MIFYMKKDFNMWHIQKSSIQENKERPFCREKEVWFVALGLNIGFEQDGQCKENLRPIVVIKKFNHEMIWAMPLTRSIKSLTEKTSEYYFDFSFLGTTSRAIISQIKPLDTKRLQYKVGSISDIDFMSIKQKIMRLIA